MFGTAELSNFELVLIKIWLWANITYLSTTFVYAKIFIIKMRQTMRKTIKLNESILNRIINGSIKRVLNEGESYGWVVDESEVDEAYNLALESGITEEQLNSEIVGCMSKEQKAQCLAFLFRCWDFREWPKYQEQKQYESMGESRYRRNF